ncbi:AraC family transcriptional regulator [Actinoplanes sp. LDG1-06]|uniref:AraC family transcriptional regulator n=1 Tax=Paractinoplanes ovalisporus TaxID=2810368 RepID=A0ABS2ALY6_9ACTN|nr:AraC family transcriptional regulator [Actinoplanes ovalisporus]MBM2620867.1 AraC family transcriptional regulator [Actinoplanes ovalisporus]
MDTLARLSGLIPRLEAAAPRGSWLPGAHLVALTAEVPPYCSKLEPMVALVVAGEKRTMLPGREFTCGPGDYLIYSVELTVTARITRADPFLAVGVRLRPELIAELLLETPEIAARDEPYVGLGVAAADEELLEAVLRLLRLVERPRDFAVLAPGVEREIHWRLLTGPQGDLVRQVGRADDRFTVVRRATRYIEDRFDQAIRVDDLARHVRVSVPTLNRRFREVTTMSPLQYQKQVRLQQARIRITAAPGDIAGVGHSVGYESSSQFSREYRRLFGVTPSQDAPGAQPRETVTPSRDAPGAQPRETVTPSQGAPT